MRPAERPPAPPRDWETFDYRGRPFLRASLPDSPPDASPFIVAETIAGRYRVVEPIAAGETSVLLGARDLRTHRDVLIKTSRVDAIAPPPGLPNVAPALAEEVRKLRHLLQTERRLLVRLRNAGGRAVPHPNDYVYDRDPAFEATPFVDPASGRPYLDEALIAAEPYLVLQRLPGITLEALLASEFPEGMDEPDALGLIRPVVRALGVLHEPWKSRSGHTWHCVYQDLKPANILVGPTGRATLLDLGGCQVVIDGVPVLEGARTPGYAPPECEGPTRVLLPCADVYGVGATLYHMLTGIDPIDRRRRHRGSPGGHLDAARLPARVSPRTREVVARCLAPRPSDRPADARRLARLLWGEPADRARARQESADLDSDLSPGTRLDGGERDRYDVLGPAWRGTRPAFDRARKVLWNYRFPDRRFVEADEDERLNVLVRRGPAADPAFELEAVLGPADIPWLPEPIDVLHPPGEPGPVLVLADAPGARLSDIDSLSGAEAAPMARESLALLDALHRRGLVAGGLDPADIVLSGADDWCYLGTDRVGRSDSPGAVAADLAAWADLGDRLLAMSPDLVAEDRAWLSNRIALARSGRASSAAGLLDGPPRWRLAIGRLSGLLAGLRARPGDT